MYGAAGSDTSQQVWLNSWATSYIFGNFQMKYTGFILACGKLTVFAQQACAYFFYRFQR